MILWLIFACAIKDGSEVLRIQKAYHEHVKETSSTELSFEQSMAKLYMQKSWEEYTNSQYQDALTLAVKCEEWLDKSLKSIDKSSLPAENEEPSVAQPAEEEIPTPNKDGDGQDKAQEKVQ